MAECLHDLLQCSICLERFTHPKMLSCQHTFCLNCLRGIAKDDKTLACPQCRTEHQLPKGGVDGLVDNMTIKSFLNVIGEGDSLSSAYQAVCFDCGRKRSLSECAHCEESICADCRASHARILQEIQGLIKFVNHDDGSEEMAEETDKHLAALSEKMTRKKREIPEMFNDLRKKIAEREDKLLRFLTALEMRVHATQSEEAKSQFTEKMKVELSACKTVSSLKTYKNLVDTIEQGLSLYLEDPVAGVEIVNHELAKFANVKLGKYVVEIGPDSLDSSSQECSGQVEQDKGLNYFPRSVAYSAKRHHVIDQHPESFKKLVPDYAVYSKRLDTLFCVSEGRVLMYALESTLAPSLLSPNITSCKHIAVTESGKILVAQGAAVYIFDCSNIKSIRIGSRLRQRWEMDINSVDQVCCRDEDFAILDRNEKNVLIFSVDGHFIREIHVERIIADSLMAVDQHGQIYVTGITSIKEKQEVGEMKGCPNNENLRKPSELLFSLDAEIEVYMWTGQLLWSIQLPIMRVYDYKFDSKCGPCQTNIYHCRNDGSIPGDARITREHRIRGLCVDGDGFLSVTLENEILVYSQEPELAHAEDDNKLVAGDESPKAEVDGTCSSKQEMNIDDAKKMSTQLKLVTTVGDYMTSKGGFAGELGGISLMPDGRMIVCEKGSNRIVII